MKYSETFTSEEAKDCLSSVSFEDKRIPRGRANDKSMKQRVATLIEKSELV